MVEDNIIEGSLKYRDGKKWKQRWAVLNKLSPVADVLQLQLYRDSRDRARGAPTKASLALPNSLALTTGFTLDKECHTLSLLCKDLSLILAFDSRDRLLQWHSKISFTLGQEQQFLVQMVQVPPKSRICLGPCRIHIRDHRFCLTFGTPPKLLAVWALIDLRRYGVVDGRFVWEGGSRSARGAGVHVALSDTPNDIPRALDIASRGALGSNNRRGSATQPSCGTIQRDAAAWLRDVGAIDLCRFSEAGDSVSIVASEAGSILSPRSEFACERRNDCDVTAGSSSSSGSLVGDDPGWWASTWASGRGSMWEVAPSPMPESLYDSPRPFPHSLTSHGVTNQQNQGSQPHFCTHSLRHKGHHKHHVTTNPSNQPCVTSNPMDNYDVPKSRYQHYDVPKKFSHLDRPITQMTMNSSHVTCLQQTVGMDTCGRMLCWAGSFMCRKNDFTVEHTEPVRVNGEGKMPLLDANTGIIIKGQSLVSCPGAFISTEGCQCKHVMSCSTIDVPYQHFKQGCRDKLPLQEKACEDPPIYAVVDKSKKISKPRAPTPPPSPQPPEEPTPTNVHPNYENVNFLDFKMEDKPVEDGLMSGAVEQCIKCGGAVASECEVSEGNEISLNNLNLLPHQSPINQRPSHSLKEGTEEAHYLLMGPGPPSLDPSQSHYLCMTNPNSKAEEEQAADYNSDSKHPTICKPGRSLSLARNDQTTCSNLRRSTSADSILHEPCPSSQVDTPDPTPCSTPMQSPPHSPFRTSTPRSDSARCVRGRQRKRHQVQCQVQCQNVYFSNMPHNDPSLIQTNISEIIVPNSSSETISTSILTSSHLSISKVSDVPETSLESLCLHHHQPIDSLPCVLNPAVNAYTVPTDIPCHDTPILRRSSSVPGKSANRDSASSSDSGVCESPRPNERVLLSHCLHSSLPRGPKQKQNQMLTQSQNKTGVNGSCRELGPGVGDGKSSSSGTSDISDYLDTLSLSSHSSSDHERLLARGASMTTLRPRSGREYSRLDRSALEQPGILPEVVEANCTTESK